MGKILEKYLSKMKSKYNCIGDYRGKGLFYAIEFVKNKKKERLINWKYINFFKEQKDMKNLLDFLWKKKLYCYARFNTLYICPALIISKKELINALNIIEIGISTIIEKKYF